MSDDPTMTGENGDPIAAEYVLGVLDSRQRREVERRLEREPALVAEVAFWEQRLSGLAAGITPVTPPAEIWSRIDAALDSRNQSAAGQLSFWRWAAIGSAALAGASLAALFYVVVLPSPRATLIARLDASGQPGFVATIDAGGSITVVPAAMKNVDQRALQLWLIAPGDRPRSLGLIDGERPVRINVPTDLAGRVSSDATLAVSVEPPGGSPTGLPTGPVIASGKLITL